MRCYDFSLVNKRKRNSSVSGKGILGKTKEQSPVAQWWGIRTSNWKIKEKGSTPVGRTVIFVFRSMRVSLTEKFLFQLKLCLLEHYVEPIYMFFGRLLFSYQPKKRIKNFSFFEHLLFYFITI